MDCGVLSYHRRLRVGRLVVLLNVHDIGLSINILKSTGKTDEEDTCVPAYPMVINTDVWLFASQQQR
jgi:hypothetical protein